MASIDTAQSSGKNDTRDSNWAKTAAADTYSKPAAQVAQDLPDHFQVKEEYLPSLFGLPERFDIEGDDSKDYGKIKSAYSFTPSFTMEDAQGLETGSAKEDAWSWGVRDDYFDEQHNPLGSVQEDAISSLMGLGKYTVTDANGARIGESDKEQALSTDFTIKDNSGELIARLHRGLFPLLVDAWSVDVYKPGVIDKRELAMIAAFKTQADNKVARQSAKK